MTPPEFVEQIRLQVRDAAVSDVGVQLQRPSGRRPPADLRELSAWFNGLPPQDKDAVTKVMEMTAHQAVFGFLCVLDGVRAIESESSNSVLRLSLERDGASDLLAPTESDYLHDIYSSVR